MIQNKPETVLAAGGAVRNERDEVLVMFRNGVWDLPKGHVEAGETLEDAALREVSEETGIPIEALQIGEQIGKSEYIHSAYGRPERKIVVWFAMRLIGNAELKPQTEEGITELRWVNTIEGLEPIWETVKTVISHL